jgi:hypothetical protein
MEAAPEQGGFLLRWRAFWCRKCWESLQMGQEGALLMALELLIVPVGVRRSRGRGVASLR